MKSVSEAFAEAQAANPLPEPVDPRDAEIAELRAAVEMLLLNSLGE